MAKLSPLEHAFNEPTPQELRDLKAAAAHKIWSHWMRYFFSVVPFENGRFTLTYDQAFRWMRQALTAFNNLPENEQKSDYDVATRYLAGFTHLPKWRQEVDVRIPDELLPTLTGIDWTSSKDSGVYINLYVGFPQSVAQVFGPYDVTTASRALDRLHNEFANYIFSQRIDDISRDAAFAAQATDTALSPVLDDAAKVDQWPSYFPDKNTITGIERRCLSPDMWEVEVRGTNGFEHYFHSLCEEGAIICYDTLVKLVSAEVARTALASVRYAKSVDGTRVTTFFDWGTKYVLSSPLSGAMRCSIFMGRGQDGWIVSVESVIDSRISVQAFSFSGARYGDAEVLFERFTAQLRAYWESNGLLYRSTPKSVAASHSIWRDDYNVTDSPLDIFASYRSAV